MSTTIPTIAIAAPPVPAVALDAALGGGQPSSAIARTYFPLTPSPTSPFRAHRHPGANSKPPRPKPYHRPSGQVADLKLHHPNLTQCGTIVGTASPFSPITPTSLSSASSSTVTTPSTLSYGYQPSRLSRCHSAFVASAEDELQLQQQKQQQQQQLPQQGLDGLLTPLSTSSLPRRRQGLQRTESAPLLVACPPISAFNQCNLACNSNNVSIPVFASTSDRPQAAPASSPVVFTADYLEARLAKFGGKIGGPPPSQSQAQQQQHKPQCVPAALGYQDQPDILSLIKDFPYASAYVDVSSVPQPQASRSQDSGVMAQAAPAAHARDEEIRKQRYAVDLIETAIKTIHKIWPETQEPDREAAPGPVTSEGKLRASFITQFPSTAVPTAAQDKATARLRRRPSHQQFTPESSPDSSKKKRKRGETSSGSEGVRDGDEKICKRSCIGETKMAYPTCPRVLTPMPELKPEPVKAAPAQSHHISLKLFVRELLRRSKTSCNTLEVALCYLDGVEETVKKLRDCLKLGIAFGTVAMAERGPYDEGMKDEGRIITAVEWMRQEAMKQEDDRMDVRGDWPHHQQGQEWAPLSPPGSDSSSDRGTKASTAATPTNQILATHPLLDARRTFLASLVLATKFIQDKAYSNKAWAKLSGLAGKEVGRCERALGGALQWRLWVGKECGSNSSLRGRSPLGNEEVESLCSGDSETVVHGENDPLAKAFMEEAMKKQKSVSTWGSDVEFSTPTAVAPAEVVARLYGDAPANSRANGSGRARTWHAPEKVDEESGALLPLAGPTPHVPLRSSAISVSSSCSTLLDQLSSFNLRSVTPMSHASQTTVVESRPTAAFGMHLVHSPLSLESEQLLNALLKGGEECEAPATVKMHVDDSASGKNKTPIMSMATSFANNEPLPLAGFMDSWQPQSSFPFTFTALPPSKLQPLQQLARLSIPKPQVQQRSQSLGSLPLPRLLHPQTAALRASGGSGSSTSPHSSSTFSSPEVLTPVHSRAGTLVEVAEYYQDWMGRGKEFQQCVNQLYCGNNGNQFGVGIQAPALQL